MFNNFSHQGNADQNHMRYYFTHSRIAVMQDRQKPRVSEDSKDIGNLIHILPVGVQNGVNALENW